MGGGYIIIIYIQFHPLFVHSVCIYNVTLFHEVYIRIIYTKVMPLLC